MLKLKVQNFGHLMQKTDPFEKTLMLGNLKAGGEGDNGGWDGWMASLTQWTWVRVNSRSCWWTGRPGVLQAMGSQRVGHDWVSELDWTVICLEHRLLCCLCLESFLIPHSYLSTGKSPDSVPPAQWGLLRQTYAKLGLSWCPSSFSFKILAFNIFWGKVLFLSPYKNCKFLSHVRFNS